MLQRVRNRFQKFMYSLFAVPFLMGMAAFPAYASDIGSASLSDTLSIFSEVFAWLLKDGSNLLSWMLDKPIILLSLALFFVGAVIGVLARIYSSF